MSIAQRQMKAKIHSFPTMYILGKKRLRLHSFGPFWTICTENQWEISEVGRLSCLIFCLILHCIVCDRYTSDYAHFTFSDTI